MNIEEQLKLVLRREAPPHGFAERVMQRIEHEQRRRGWSSRAVAAALLVVMLGGTWIIHHATSQLRLALTITSEKVNTARAHVVR